MMIHNLSPRSRLRDWREFRSQIENLNEFDQLLAVSNYWFGWPFVDYYLDPDNQDSWPSPWEIIQKGHVCPVSRGYMMAHTLIFSGWHSSRVELQYIDNKSKSAVFMILTVDAKYITNYSQGVEEYVDIITKDCVILNSYQFK